MRDRFRVWESITVHWGDMDALGHVNNARYFTYCETARFRYFGEVGLAELGEGGRFGPMLVSATCNFRRQVRYPAVLEVGTRTSRIGTTSFTMEYGIFEAAGTGGTGEPAAEGSAVVVWVDYGSGRPQPLPAVLRERLRRLDGLGDE